LLEKLLIKNKDFRIKPIDAVAHPFFSEEREKLNRCTVSKNLKYKSFEYINY